MGSLPPKVLEMLGYGESSQESNPGESIDYISRLNTSGKTEEQLREEKEYLNQVVSGAVFRCNSEIRYI